MRTSHKIIIASIAFGGLAWVVEAILDYYFFYEGGLMGLLLTDVPSHELYIRLLIWGLFIVFGFLASNVVDKRQKAESRIKHLNNVLKAIRNVNQLITHEKDREKLIEQACKLLVETRGYYSAWIALFDDSNGLGIITDEGLGNSFSKLVEQMREGYFPPCVDEALQKQSALITEDPYTICVHCPLSREYEGRGGATVPLIYGGETYGLLVVSIPKEYVNDNEEQELLQELANDVSFALYSIKEEDEKRQAKIELRQSEEKLRREREFLEQIAETSPVSITKVDRDGNIVYANNRAEEVLGLSKSDIKERTYDDMKWKITDFEGNHYPKEDLPFELVKSRKEPIYDVEHAIEWPNGERKYLSINAAPLFNEDGDFDGMVSAIEDVTEKVENERKLKESEEYFRSLYESMNEGLCLHELVYNDAGEPIDYRIIDVNPRYEEILDLKKSDVINKLASQIYGSDEPPYLDTYAQVAETGEPTRFETYFPPMDKHFSISVFSPIEGEFATVFKDITDRKQAEEQQKSLIHELQTINDTIVKASRIEDIEELCHLIGMSVHNLNPDSYIAVSYYDRDLEAIKIQELIGLGDTEKVFELIGDPQELYIHPRKMGEEARLFTTGKVEKVTGIYDLLAGEIPQDVCHQLEDILEVKSVYTVGFALGDDTWGGISILSTEGDVRHRSAIETLASHFSLLIQRRQAERTIRRSEELYSTLVENVNDMVYLLDSKGEVNFFNSYVRKHYSLSEEEADNLGDTPLSFFWCGESIDTVQNAVDTVIERGRELSIDCFCEDRYYLLKITPLHESGELSGMIAVARDFTEYKKAEEALQEREKILEDIVEGSPVPTFVLDENHIVLYWNRACEKISGVYSEEVIGTKHHWYPWYLEERPTIADLIIDGSKEDLLQYYGNKQLKPSIKEGAYEAIDYFPHLGENGMWLYFTASPLKDEKGRINGAIETLQDVTERKSVEESLRESEEKYRTYVDNSPVAIFVVNEDGEYIDVNNSACKMLGYTRDELLQMSIIDLDRTENSLLGFGQLKSTGRYRAVRQLEHKDGLLVDVDLNAVSLGNNKYMAFCSDITEKIKAEKSLEESKKRFQTVIENLPHSVFVHDLDGNLVMVNKASCRNTGYAEDELLDMTVGDIDPESLTRDDRENLWLNLQIGGFTWVNSIHRRKDGSEYPVEVYINAITLEGEPMILGIAQDVTERKESERKIRESLEEKETLLKEIHHRVKNNLQVVSGLLYLQATNAGQEASEALVDSMNRVKSMALIHEELYQSETLVKIEFNGYINRQLSHLLNSYNAENVILNTNIKDIFLSIDTAIPTALIINELVSNSLKHAFPEGRGEITISMYQEDKIKLIVSDNGIGFPDVDFNKLDSLGMQLVSSLVKQIKGSIGLHRDEGTTWMITFQDRGVGNGE